MKPVFVHDCDACIFIGHYFDHDVYICPVCMNSIVARYGDEGSHYASQPMEVLKVCLKENSSIGGTDREGNSWSLPYREYVFSDKCNPATAAMILALAMKTLEDYNE